MDIQVVDQNKTISSVEVAEMVKREHPKVMRDIRNIIEHLGGQAKIGQSYFTESSYTNAQNKNQPCFLLTKKGCELYATRMTGAKGTQFAVKYIERFNEMEQVIRQQLPTNNLELALRAALDHEVAIKEIKTDVSYLKDNMRIDRYEQKQISELGKNRVIRALGGNKSAAYLDKSLRSRTFSAMWRELKGQFNITSYEALAKVEFANAMNFLSIWEPNTTLRVEIQAVNKPVGV